MKLLSIEMFSKLFKILFIPLKEMMAPLPFSLLSRLMETHALSNLSVAEPSRLSFSEIYAAVQGVDET